jgi:hypothetical protein
MMIMWGPTAFFVVSGYCVNGPIIIIIVLLDLQLLIFCRMLGPIIIIIVLLDLQLLMFCRMLGPIIIIIVLLDLQLLIFCRMLGPIILIINLSYPTVDSAYFLVFFGILQLRWVEGASIGQIRTERLLLSCTEHGTRQNNLKSVSSFQYGP